MPSTSSSSRVTRSPGSSALAPPARPSSATVPPRRAQRSAWATTAGLPEQSNTVSAPRPPVAALAEVAGDVEAWPTAHDHDVGRTGRPCHLEHEQAEQAGAEHDGTGARPE